MNMFHKELSPKDIVIIFSAFLNCPNYDECCDNCVLNDNRFDGYKIGCFRLRDLAMQRAIEIFSKGDDNGKND